MTPHYEPPAAKISVSRFMLDEDKIKQPDTCNSPSINSEKKKKKKGEKISYLGLMIVPGTARAPEVMCVLHTWLLGILGTHHGLLIVMRPGVILSSVI